MIVRVAVRRADRRRRARRTRRRDPLGHRPQLGAAARPGRQVRQQHDELLAAEPADEVLLAHAGPQLGGHRGQHVVAREVPVARR